MKMKQQTLAMANGFERYTKKTRRALFLEEMEQWCRGRRCVRCERDPKLARREGVSPGGDVFVRGLPTALVRLELLTV